ncbi:toxin-antitoxin system HicB family antitoxin [Streptomyces sp. YIM 121038]|uniref:toxin-antitoxin system HicB family antitoxin n=1 Tax=Streptomyces sp. YIM 121038 TaxID=2136401 RepID=UPI0011109036|nr:toxin-antitoxin system HicB family antitoxin [Streptomyces sp. YIM 121038]
MNLTPYVDQLRQELAVAAEAGGEEARAVAERLIAPLESATRLTLLNVLSAAMDEVTRDLAPGSVDVRLRGGDPDFVVTPPPLTDAFEAPVMEAPVTRSAPAPAPVPEAEEGGTARINLRLPMHLKSQAEEAAAAESLSVNAWLVRTVAEALRPSEGPQPLARGEGVGNSFTGWAR